MSTSNEERDMTEETRQTTAFMKRADTTGQQELTTALKSCGYSDSTILNELERKYFLNRKQSELLLSEAK